MCVSRKHGHAQKKSAISPSSQDFRTTRYINHPEYRGCSFVPVPAVV